MSYVKQKLDMFVSNFGFAWKKRFPLGYVDQFQDQKQISAYTIVSNMSGSLHFNMLRRGNLLTYLSQVQTPLHSCAEPNWWIKSGKRAASESIRYGSFNSVRQRC